MVARLHGRWGINPRQENNYPAIGLRDEGAYGDRSHDDSLALERALKKGKRLYGKFTLYVEPGWYRIRPCILDGYSGIDVIGETINLNIAESPEVGGSNFELISGSNDAVFSVLPTCGVIWFHKIYIRGNQAGQTSGSGPGIDTPDSGVPARSVILTFCRIERCRGGGVRGGTNRQAGQLIHNVIQLCGFEPDGVTPANGTGHDGVLLAANSDWMMTRNNIGAHTRMGLYLTGAGTLLGTKNNLYSNKRGLQIDSTATLIDLAYGSIDRNREEGAVIVGPVSADRMFKRTLANYTFQWNCQQDGNKADVRVLDDPLSTTSLENCTWNRGPGPVFPKYSVETQGTTTNLRVLNRTVRTDVPPYTTAFCNDLSKLQLAYTADADAPSTGYVLMPDNNGVMRKFMTRD